jgi:hypothetical protein
VYATLQFTLDKLPAAEAEAARTGCARGLHYIKEVQYDEYDSDNDQSVNPTAGAREPWTYVPTEKA